jgi:NAD(P)-dependent dehydrogenase (short-subunit alcohol dehydrogenase family)
MDPLRDRVAIVTGGAGGIGLAVARGLAERGASIVIADLDERGIEKAEKELAPLGRPVLGVKTDVSKLDSVRALAEAVLRRFGAVHVVCNNAGVAVFGEMADATHRDWEYVMNVDFWGVVHGVETFVPILIDQKQGGHIVNTASMAGLVGMHWLGLYSAAKFAVVGLTEALHRELKRHRIGVSVLCPMIVETDLNANSARLRPEDLRNEGETFVPPVAAMTGGVIAKEEVARRVVRGIERGDLYILTHPEQRDILRRRAKKLDSMFEDGTW